MDVQAYIATGILEVYILGGLSTLEAQEVERMEALHPEVKIEIEALRLSMEAFALKNMIAPPLKLKKSILDQLEEPNVISESSTTKILSFYQYATAASVVLMLFCGSSAYYFFSKWKGAEQKILALAEQQSVYATQFNKATFEMNALVEGIDNIRDTSIVKINLKGVAQYPNNLAIVYWNKRTEEVFIDAGNLPKLPEGMQYQLWALYDGKPVDAGVFETNKKGFQKVKQIRDAQAYAITVEKIGGSESPTLSTLRVIGNV